MWILGISAGPLLPAFSIHPYVGRWSWLDAVDDYVAFVGADFHVVSRSCSIQSFTELLEFFTASHQIDVVGKPQVAERSSSDGH